MYTLIEAVSPYLTEIEKAMLSLTCRSLQKCIERKYSLIDSCIVSKDLRMLNIVERWGNNWNNESCRLLGERDGIGFLMVYIQRFNLEQLGIIAEAFIRGNSPKVLTYFWTTYQLWEDTNVHGFGINGKRIYTIVKKVVLEDQSTLMVLAQVPMMETVCFHQYVFALACKYKNLEACGYLYEINCCIIFLIFNQEDYDWVSPYYEVRLLE